VLGELSLPLQSKLLRVLQEREIQPLGSSKVEKIDVRLLASTQRDLQAEVKAGRFREDLYYRVAVVELLVPSPRERREDIPLLAREFARKYSERFGLDNVAQLAPEFLELLQRAPWPGNVGQLENALARCVALATGSVIGPAAFELVSGPTVGGETPSAPDGLRPEGPTFREQMEAFERNLLSSALAATANNQSEAARRLGLNRATLYDRLKKYGLLPESRATGYRLQATGLRSGAPKPEARSPKPEARSPKPEARSPKPGVRSELSISSPKPEARSL
jgi:two-component system response regulator AtoC